MKMVLQEYSEQCVGARVREVGEDSSVFGEECALQLRGG